mmetsp:Transcript_28501/g.73050  ORF Transcript_28501/g.73050 Transcript_28501/m.73050 type:complete len:84 (+) Transcript_28501:1900-2151(+)
MLHLGWVLEAAIDNSAEQFRFEEKITKTRSVDARIRASLFYFVVWLTVINGLILRRHRILQNQIGMRASQCSICFQTSMMSGL